MVMSRQKNRARLQLLVAISFFLPENDPPNIHVIPEKLAEVARELTLHPEKRLTMVEIAKKFGFLLILIMLMKCQKHYQTQI